MPQICVIDLKMRQANQSEPQKQSATGTARARSWLWARIWMRVREYANTRIREYETNSTSQVQRVNSFSFLASALSAVLCCVIDECCIFWTQREVAVAVAVGGWLHCVALMRHWPFVWPDNEPASCTEHGARSMDSDWHWPVTEWPLVGRLNCTS